MLNVALEGQAILGHIVGQQNNSEYGLEGLSR
jgi:hypothetical protein